MKTQDIKTIDVNVKEWFDSKNANSYFSGNVTINFGMKNEKEFNIRFQYGYDDHYKDVAFEILQKQGFFKGETSRHWRVYDKYNIVARHNKIENCKEKDLK